MISNKKIKIIIQKKKKKELSKHELKKININIKNFFKKNTN